MDPTTVAAITGALTVLSTEVAKGAASEAGKNAWQRIKALLGSKSGEALEKAQTEIVAQLEADPEVVRELLDLLRSSQSKNTQQLVGTITADKVVVAGQIETLNM